MYLNKFIADGIHFDYPPGQFEHLEDEYGVPRMSVPTLEGRRLVLVNAYHDSLDYPGVHKRKLHRQAWKASWSEEAFMDSCMYNYLRNLYTLQKPFWIQFDDVMTRSGTNLFCPDEVRKDYFTPTYPIAPYEYDNANLNNYNGTVFVNFEPQWNNFTVDSDIGLVRFATALEETDIVHMAYTWKAFVQIVSIDLYPFEFGNEVYAGTVVFEQINPNYSYDPWNINVGCGVEYGESGFLGLTDQNSLPTAWSRLSWGDSRYMSDYSLIITAPGYSDVASYASNSTLIMTIPPGPSNNCPLGYYYVSPWCVLTVNPGSIYATLDTEYATEAADI